MKKPKKIIYRDEDRENPLKKITKKDLEGWEIGDLRIYSKNRANNLRNIICNELGIKKLVFGSKSNKKK